ncbi:uncharacterized protein LOC112450823 [Kryptolebias marmoratus]|uniref:uncharacterized protein LOC112450823 n=1 Tax=Kryptolebias marmoratus TaxID=37003 RepID=UPI000D52F8D3|nr:uncharacterized protein LOC112450823 [Kryptolebias marmoratus]
MKCVVVLLSLLSLGRSAPLSSCDALLKPINISKEEMLGSWMFVGVSSDIPGSRSLFYLLSSVWLNVTPTSKSNVLRIVQSQKVLGKCSSISYDVIFENSTLIIEQPFYLKETYLPTECADCLAIREDITTGNDSFTSLLMCSRSRSISPAAVEMLKKQAECLQMSAPIMSDPTSELCPEDITPTDGISFISSVLEAKLGQKFAKFLDTIFDTFRS